MAFNLIALLLPKEGKFFDYLSEQTTNLLEGCLLFKESIECLGQPEGGNKKKYFALIQECERKGDLLERKILEELNDAFITPIDREDIHDIATEIDTALDILNGTSRKMEIYAIKTVPPNIHEFTKHIVSIVNEMSLLITALKTKSNMLAGIASMHKIENEADELFHHSMQQLFSNGTSAVDIIKMKEIYERLESVVDVVDRIGKMIRGVKFKTG
ncbi:MAG TPA: hypothetical protein DCO75_08120 [Fibrobacteres bacterium]|jgi:uncharacterized protein|nr:hypothetical protein [Fibrobacterota bacterium]